MAASKPTDQMTSQEYLDYQVKLASKKKSKYSNKWVKYDGINFQSLAERNRYVELVNMKAAGAIKDFKRQVLFKFIINGVLVTTYRCDFVVYTIEGGHRVEDVKGVITDEYLLKKRLMKAIYKVDVIEPNLAEPATKRSRSFKKF
jgi:hypothetical protein